MQNRASHERIDISCDGLGTLRVGKSVRRRLVRALSRARQFNALDADAGDALRRVAADSRLIEASVPPDRLRALPARRGRVRVLATVSALLRGGEDALTEERLLDMLRDIPLTVAELKAVPLALRVAAAEALASVCESVVKGASDCMVAERWLDRPGRLRRSPSPDFIERALRRCGEEGLCRARARLEACLQRDGVSAERAIHRAHDDRAHLLLRLDNLTRALRLLDALDWRVCFEALSEVDDELRRDPAGVYPLMDEASRDDILERVSEIARAAGLGECTVARHAVAAARERRGLSLVDEPRLDRLDAVDLTASCCWWLYDDAGRTALLKRIGKSHVRLRRRVPDPRGAVTILASLAMTLLLTALLWRWLPRRWMALACLPACWTASDAIVHRAFPLFAKPNALLKLKIDRLPDCWRTLIVTPVLLTDVPCAEAACDNLETLGCLEDDPNLACLLLGDFADADRPELPGDDAIVRRVRARIAEMNRRAGREKYYYLHRPRTLNATDRRYMGKDRKRGALMDLNRALMGGPSAFSVEGAACEALRGKYAYVVTLDADTRMLPGTAHRLVGALAHPLNRRCAVLQPRMEVAPSSVNSRFALMYSGVGGLDTYPTRVSSLWMDLTGAGIYGGKGVYRVRDFQRAVEDRLPEGRVLSHDLIEGALAGAGAVCDVALYDGCPATLPGWLLRQHRWTRGDWQLLPMIFSRRLPLHLADRFRMLDNLMRSLRAPVIWLMLMISVWTGRVEGAAIALLLLFLNALLHPLDKDNWRRGLIELVTLPVTAYNTLDAAIRAVWRVYISGKHLMDWVPSADADRDAMSGGACGKLAALLTLPGLFVPDGTPLALALALLFWVGTDWVRDMEHVPVDDAPALTDADRAMLADLARDTWRFFSESVTPDGSALPPDNAQLDPPAGAARRTSPTNIGLYLLSCISARQLGLIDREECRARLGRTLDAVERAEKWRGHLFNWIDIDTLKALRPRYVSAVDSGNLAACALTCARLIEDEALSARLRALAEGMDFAALYDDARRLFRIGVDVDSAAPSDAHYDLLASEARILSYTAIMLGQVPIRHWARLGRGCTRAGGGAALMSWSGTMFEYLMPELLMRAPALSLLGESARRAVRAQMAQGTPWGISESGYHAFDAQMNYQYRAFGLKALALGGAAEGGVIAPYASALALGIRPRAACENLRNMAELGWRGEQGFYEAADLRQPGPDGRPALVMSHMAHHQGMTLCAICNALDGDRLVNGFMGDPRARALSLLLEERPVRAARVRPVPRDAEARPAAARIQRSARHDMDVHLLSGRRAHALVTPEGAIHYARDGFDATRFYGDLADWPDPASLHLRVNGVPARPRLSCRYDAGSARFEGRVGGLELSMTVSLSPEDDTLYRAVTLKNASARAVALDVMDVVPVALQRPRDFRAHPAFQLLFVESEALDDNGLLFRRRPRNPDERCPVLTHRVFTSGSVSRESRYERVLDREGHPRFEPEGGVGTVLNPVSALKVSLRLAPGGTDKLCFALRLDEPGDSVPLQCLPDRAAALNRSRTEAMLGFLGISPALYHRLDRLSALLLDPRLASRAKGSHAPAPGTPREALWPMGISGDRPILSMRVTDAAHAAAVQGIVRAQRFYRAMGLDTDLALIDAGPGGYQRPVRDMLQSTLDAASLRGQPNVFVLGDLTADQIETVRRASALCLDSDRDLFAQIRPLLEALEPRAEAPQLNPGRSLLEPAKRDMDNGFGGFIDDGYEIDVLPGRPTPAPWCDLLASDGMGILLTERGGGFIWHGNSRFCRLTGFRGDPMRERFGLSLSLIAEDGSAVSLLPSAQPAMPFRVRFTKDEAAYRFSTERLSGEVRFSIAGDAVLMEIQLRLQRLHGILRISADWLMGAERDDAAFLRTWHADGALFASGAAEGVGWLCCDRVDAETGEALSIPVSAGDNRLHIALGWAEDITTARNHSRTIRDGILPDIHREDNDALVVETPDAALNRMMNSFLPHQVRASRLLGRTGYYQPGGAFGFRDQLQDLLALIPLEPERVRGHLLLCARRQFSAGDALHWWHMPYLGVRTRISDDLLFLPFVTAEYVKQTGDVGVLDERIPYLEEVPIPEDREDVFRAMTPSGDIGTLHDHCMRAFRASDRVGAHGLALMGAGDWNDGMNRVGHLGKGESVWLSQFLAACADSYAEICPIEADAAWLRALARRYRGAAELYGWDGQWYLRAYMDDGTALGSADGDACRIDLIPQAWAALAGLSPERCRTAVDSAWKLLADEDADLIRLLTPPFSPDGVDPGYIRGYPGGVRENGAQYTHAACWLLLALVRLGDADRAHRALSMLLPPYHADTPEKAMRYRVEPYVTAADVYDLPDEKGRGGWTWYTGSAAWLYVGALALLGYERRGNRVRLNALLGPWPEVRVTLRYGKSRYRLACGSGIEYVTLDDKPVGDEYITLTDDGAEHEARFPPRT